jgi:hypothetical protein
MSAIEQSSAPRDRASSDLVHLVEYLKTLSPASLEFVVSTLAAVVVDRRKTALLCSDSSDDPQATACIIPFADYLRMRQTPEQAEELKKALEKAAKLGSHASVT